MSDIIETADATILLYYDDQVGDDYGPTPGYDMPEDIIGVEYGESVEIPEDSTWIKIHDSNGKQIVFECPGETYEETFSVGREVWPHYGSFRIERIEN